MVMSMNNGFVDSINLDLAYNTSQETVKNNIQCYEVMHGERQVAQINIRGEAEILDEVFFHMIFIWKQTKTLIH